MSSEKGSSRPPIWLQKIEPLDCLSFRCYLRKILPDDVHDVERIWIRESVAQTWRRMLRVRRSGA